MSSTNFTAGTVIASSWLNDVDDITYRKCAEWVSIKDPAYGAVGDGVTDDTAAIQAALSSGATAVYVPTGTYLCGTLVMPNVFGFVLYGEGPVSTLKQKSTGKLLTWATASNVYNEQTIRDLGLTGTSGTDHTIDTTGAGGLTLRNLYFTDVPATKTSIYINGATSTRAHDVRLNGIQIYSNTAGHSGIRLGPYASDSTITDFIMNGNVLTDYCLYFDNGAIAIVVHNSHPYNAKINVMRLVSTNTYHQFNSVVFDNALQDVVAIAGGSLLNFTDCYFQSIDASYSGVDISSSSSGIQFVNCKWQGATGADSCVVSDSGSSTIGVIGGVVAQVSDFTTPFNLQGSSSFARGIAGYNPMGLEYFMTGCSVGTQAQSTTRYLGVNGLQTTVDDTVFVVPHNSTLVSFAIAVSATPAAGQTMAFTAQKNAADVGATLTLNNGDFGGTLTINSNFAAGDQLNLKSVFSATSGAARVRYSVRLTA